MHNSHFGVCGYDLTALDNGWVVHTAVIYGAGVDGEYSYELWVICDLILPLGSFTSPSTAACGLWLVTAQ